MTELISDSIQDYLKIIYVLTQNGESASTSALATRLGFAPASVTGMMQKLSSITPALVSYRKHQGVILTSAGQRAALEVIRHHRLIEAWLVQTLGYSWDEVHNEAEKLEHVISEDFEMRVAAALGHPDRDPHGEPIPSAELVMPADKSIPLSSMQPEQEAATNVWAAQIAPKGDMPREDYSQHRVLFTCHGRGTLVARSTASWGVTGYVMTGTIGAVTIDALLLGRQKVVGFQPATSVVGHKRMRAELESGGVFGQMSVLIS